MKFQIKKKQQPKFQFVELLKAILNKSSRYQFLHALLERKNHEQS